MERLIKYIHICQVVKNKGPGLYTAIDHMDTSEKWGEVGKVCGRFW